MYPPLVAAETPKPVVELAVAVAALDLVTWVLVLLEQLKA